MMVCARLKYQYVSCIYLMYCCGLQFMQRTLASVYTSQN